MCRDGLNGIHEVSIGLAIGWLASVSVHTFNLHERALNNVAVSVESHLHHCVKWNLQWTKENILSQYLDFNGLPFNLKNRLI